MGMTLITPAATFPVTLAEAKAQCRIDGGDEDALINGLIAAATDYVEQYTGRAIMAQTWKLTLDAFSDAIVLPKGPVQSVTSVQYYDTDGVERTATNYTLDNSSDPAWIVRNAMYSWPTTQSAVNVVNITFVAGYSVVPPSLKHAILLLIGDWYRGRENTVLGNNQPAEMPHAVTALLSNHRSFTF